MIRPISAAWRRHRFLPLALALAIAVVPAGRAQDSTAFSQDRLFLSRLMEIQFYDYAAKHLARMRKRYPDRQQQIGILEVDLLIQNNQKQEAVALLEKVKPGAEAYPDAQLQLAALSEDREKVQYYEQYFKHKKEISGRADVQDWLGAVVGYATTLADLGEAKKANEALKMLERISPENEQAQRQIQFFTAEMKLNLAAAMRDAREPLDSYKPLVEEAKQSASKMIFKPDFFAAQAYGELMHAHILLGEPEMAQEVLQDAYGFCKPMEQSLKESTGSLALSPVARLLYYRGEMFYEFARQDAKKKGRGDDVTKDYMLKAAQQYALVMQNYENSRFYRKAASRFNHVKNGLKQLFDVDVELGGGQDQKQKYSLGLDDYGKENWAAAAQSFLEGARAAWNGPKVTDCLFMASVSLYKDGRFLESMAVADLMADRWPEEKKTHDALYNVGWTLFKEARAAEKERKDEVAARFSRWSDRFFIRFVELAPADPKAATVAWRVAESQFARANDLRDLVNRLQQADAPARELDEKLLQMRETYLKAVPLYQLVAENYGGTQQGTRAYYKIGWAYHMADKSVEAAEAFLNYIAAQNEPVPEKIEAKALAADRLMRAGFPEEAIEHYREVLEWTGADSQYDKTSAAFQSYREIARAQIPWGYDRWVTKLQEQIDALEVQRAAAASQQAEEEAEPAAAEDGQPEPVKLDPEVIAAQLDDVREQLAKVRTKTLEEFESYVAENPRNAEYTPLAMLKLGIMYGETEQYDKAAAALKELQSRFPDTDAGNQAIFSLFRAYVKTGNTEEAARLSAEMRQQIPTYAVGNLNYIANNMVDFEQSFEFGGLDPELALMANQELLRRAEDPNNPDYARLQSQKERIRFRIAICHYIMGSYDKAVTAVERLLADNERSPYTWDATMIKGLSQAARENWNEALRTFGEVVAYVDKAKLPSVYYWATLESARAMIATRDRAEVRRAIGRLKQLTEFLNIEDVPEKARPLIERAYYEEAVALALLGEQTEALRATNEYLKKFPDGRYKKEINRLPPPL